MEKEHFIYPLFCVLPLSLSSLPGDVVAASCFILYGDLQSGPAVSPFIISSSSGNQGNYITYVTTCLSIIWWEHEGNVPFQSKESRSLKAHSLLTSILFALLGKTQPRSISTSARFIDYPSLVPPLPQQQAQSTASSLSPYHIQFFERRDGHVYCKDSKVPRKLRVTLFRTVQPSPTMTGIASSWDRLPT